MPGFCSPEFDKCGGGRYIFQKKNRREGLAAMTAIILFCILSLFLVVGKILRVGLPLLQKLYLPSSVIGGIAGLLVIQCLPGLIPQNIVATMSRLPGFLINIIFASLFLGMATPKVKTVFTAAFPQLCFGQILAWGQYAIGLGLTGFVLMPLFGIHPAFGNLLEIGFEGGHGTVGGMAEVFESNAWSDGIALGYTVATVGMILAIVLGMILVNWAHRKGVVREVVPFEEQDKMHRRGLYKYDERPSAGYQTVLCDSIDSLAWHIALLGMAVAVGFLLLTGCQKAEIALLPDASRRIFAGFPLFPLCMIGGLLIQNALQKCRLEYLIDGGQMRRLAGAALDFLVVAAIATIRIEVVVRNWLPLLILVLCGAVQAVLMVIYLAPRLFRNAWFERAIADFGQALGVTATGLLLLRTVDPENRTEAATAFGYKQLLHEPFMGGGICTALALTLVFAIGWFKVFLISCVLLVLWSAAAAWIVLANRRS